VAVTTVHADDASTPVNDRKRRDVTVFDWCKNQDL